MRLLRTFAVGVFVPTAACGGGAGDTALVPLDGSAPVDASTTIDGQAIGPATDASAGSPDGSVPVSLEDAAQGTEASLGSEASLGADASGPCATGFPSVTDFGQPGPFMVAIDNSTKMASLGTADCTIYRPSALGMGGVKNPVVVWGEGTDAPQPSVYAAYAWLWNQWASHGFIVAIANTPNAGTGKEMLTCLDWVEAQDTTAGSPYEGHVATGFAGASGHSQGGGGSIMAGRDPRIVVTVPFMAYTQGLGYDPTAATLQHGPMLLMSGSADTIAPPAANQMPVFQNTNVPTFWGTLAGADHVTFAVGGEKGYLAPSTAWLRMLLMCDDSARAMFYGPSCGLCTNSQWTVQRKDIP